MDFLLAEYIAVTYNNAYYKFGDIIGFEWTVGYCYAAFHYIRLSACNYELFESQLIKINQSKINQGGYIFKILLGHHTLLSISKVASGLTCTS